jgi:hypothetical protein
VLKALYLPTMKLVALKSVPIYSAERRHQMVQVSQSASSAQSAQLSSVSLGQSVSQSVSRLLGCVVGL